MLNNVRRLFFLPLLLFIALVLFFPYKHSIAFYLEDTDQMLAFFPINESDEFQIVYTHSIHLTDVIESYKMIENKFIQTELQYENFAIGMPSSAEGNEVFEKKDGKYIISNMERHFPFIDLRIGQVRANHRLVYKGEAYVLSDEIGGGKWVRMVPARLNLWQQLKGVNISES